MGIAVNQDVVKESGAEYSKEVPKGVIDKVLETSGGIGQTKGYHLVFEMAISSPEHGFPFHPFGDPQVVVPIPEVKLCILSSFLQVR